MTTDNINLNIDVDDSEVQKLENVVSSLVSEIKTLNANLGKTTTATRKVTASQRAAASAATKTGAGITNLHSAVKRFRFESASLDNALVGLINRFARGNKQLLGLTFAIGGTVTVIARMIGQVERLSQAWQEYASFVPDWETADIQQFDFALQRLGLSEQVISRLFDAYGEGVLRIADGTSLLTQEQQQLAQQAQSSLPAAVQLLESVRREYDRIREAQGAGAARRYIDESFGGTGGEGLFTTFNVTQAGSVQRALAETNRLTDHQIQSMYDAIAAGAEFRITMQLFALVVLDAVDPLLKLVTAAVGFFHSNSDLSRILKVALIPTLVILVGVLALVAIGFVAIGVKAAIAFAPVIGVVAAVVAVVAALAAGVYFVVTNFDAAVASVKSFIAWIGELLRKVTQYVNNPAVRAFGNIVGGVTSLIGGGEETQSRSTRQVNQLNPTPALATAGPTTITNTTNIEVSATIDSDEMAERRIAEEVERSQDTAL